MTDYWLGGEHHYPVDVAAARAFEGAYGPCAAIFRSLRAFCGRAVGSIAAGGIDRFLVFGAGIPSRGAVHEIVPHASVLYTDADPQIVAQGKGFLGTREKVSYAWGDAADPAGIDPEALDAVLPDRRTRPIGLVFLGVAAFLDDPALSRAFAAMHDLAAPGSRLAFDFDSMELSAHPDALAMMGPGFHMREPADFVALLGRWRVTEDGVVPVARWRPDGPPEEVPDAFWGGVAVKDG
jgi:hypothetical protein